MSALSVAGLTVRYGDQVVLDAAALQLDAGEIAVVAAGGASGKTSLAAALCGATVAVGSVAVDGVRLEGPPSRRVAQGLSAAVRDGHVISGCTVTEALTVAARAARDGRRRPGDVLARLPALAGRRTVDAVALSGGEQQLLQVACAWLAARRVLVLDAPTVGLAEDAAAAARQMVADVAADGVAVLWLEPDDRAAPAPPSWRLTAGRLTRV